MHIILNHENADFDALAAMLAAHKLDPAAIPVLPNRLNSNVERFLARYRSALPFVARDSPAGSDRDGRVRGQPPPEAVGAATTPLVEQIQARHIALMAIEATLLLLGIYQRTGSLTSAAN